VKDTLFYSQEVFICNLCGKLLNPGPESLGYSNRVAMQAYVESPCLTGRMVSVLSMIHIREKKSCSLHLFGVKPVAEYSPQCLSDGLLPTAR